MTTSEIIKTVAIYNRVLELLLVCKETNEANNYDTDNLFVECDEAGYYTNELGDIMPNRFNKPTYFCKSIAETAAKFTDLCLKANVDIYDIYTSYEIAHKRLKRAKVISYSTFAQKSNTGEIKQ